MSWSGSGHNLFVLVDNGTCGNRGCEAILRSTVSILEKEFHGCRFVSAPFMAGETPDETFFSKPNVRHCPPCRYPRRRLSAGWLALQARKRILRRDWSPYSFERFLPKADAVFGLGGDTLTMDYGNARSHFDILRFPLRYGRPMIIWGASVGPFDQDRDFERQAAEWLAEIPLILVRESLTRAYLESIGVAGNLKSMADPAFVLEPEEPELPDAIRKVLEQGCLGINLSELVGRFQDESENWPTRAVAILSEIDKSIDLPILLIYHVSYKGNDDHAFLGRLKENLGKTRNRIELLPSGLNAPELKWIISRCVAMVGARTHSTIAALSTCVPALSLGYSVKSRGINKDIFGHVEWVLHVRDACREEAASRIAELLRRREEVRAHLVQVMPGYKATAWDAAKHVRELIEHAT